MTIRHTFLAVGTVLVLGMALYLVREVSRTPPDAEARTDPREPPAAPATSPAAPAATGTHTAPPTRATIPTGSRVTTTTTPATEPSVPPTTDVPPPETARILDKANPKLDAIMSEANRAYDTGDFDEAKQIALKVLEKAPGTVRMLRIVVSAECIGGDSALAQKYFAQLPVGDRAQMRTRCDRYGVTLKDP